MINLIFKEGHNYASAFGLTQWDKGRKVHISGLNIQGGTMEIHFAHEGGTVALREIGTVQNGNITAKIPNALLQSSNNIKIYIYESTEDVSKTIAKGVIYVEAREKPEDYEDEEYQNVLQEILAIAQSVRDDADNGVFNGEDGYSPSIVMSEVSDGVEITVYNKDGYDTKYIKNGKEGLTGKSAYEIAVKLGFEGTEEQWIDSLKGEKGDPGQNATDEQVKTAVNEYMEEHTVKSDAIAIVNTVSGQTPLIITDSAERTIRDLKLFGKTEQNNTTGAQLLNPDEFEVGILENGIMNPGITQYFSTGFILIQSGKTYRRTSKYPGNFYYDADKRYISKDLNGDNIIPPEGCAYVRFSYDDGMENSVMMNEGAILKNYEPYTGGKPSPSPDYPQEIVTAGKLNEETGKYEVEVKVTGKNLFDVDSIEYFAIDNSDKRYSGYKLYLPPGKYILGTENKGDYSGVAEYLYAFIIDNNNNNNGTIKYVVANAKPSLAKAVSFTIKENEILIFYDAIANKKPEVSKPLFEKYDFMIYAGEKLDVYEPYREPQTLTLTSDRPITKWDKLVERDGQIGWLYQSEELVLNGDEEWVLYDYEGTGVSFYTSFPISAIGYQNSLVKEMINVNQAWVNKYYGIYSIYSDHKNATSKYFRPPSDKIKTVDEWKAWLRENTLTMVYKTSEPTFTPLPQSAQDAIRALSTYYPTTVLTVDDGEVSGEVEVTYTADTKNYIDGKFEELNKALVNTQAQLL